MSKSFVFKPVLMILALVLTLSSTLSLNASASTQELNTEEAIEILEALDQSSVQMEDGTSLINENKLKEQLGNNENYDEIYTSLDAESMLTTKENPKIATMAADNRNPKWVAERDSCAKKYLAAELGLAVGAGIINAMNNGNWKSAIKQIGKLGLKMNVGGLIVLYGHMNVVCINQANSKYSMY